MSGRKIGLLLLILFFGAAIETAWQVRGDVRLGPEGCRVMSGRFYGPSYSFEQQDERAVASAVRLELRNTFGDVRVTAGAPGVVKARLRKVVYQATEERARAFAGRIELRLAGEGGILRLGTNREEIGRSEDTGFETHLEIEAPKDSVVLVRNEHGRVDVRGVASADVASSFEAVSIEDVAGDVKLESRNGDVNVRGVGGRLELSSRHGGVELSSLAGPAKLDVQHGELTVRDAAALEIAQQHGGVSVERALDLVVRAEHAEVQGSDLRGKADIETTFGAVKLARVAGTVRAKAEHGAISAQDVAGAVSAEASFESVEVERVDGPLQIAVHHGGLDAKGFAQGARVRADGGDVRLEGFSGAVDLELERGNAELAPRAAISAPIGVSVAHGEAHLEVPEGSRVEVEAESRRGELTVSDLPGLAVSDEESDSPHKGQRVKGRTAEGGSSVRLRADGDVSIKASPAGDIAGKVAAPSPAAIATKSPAEAAVQAGPAKARPSGPPAPAEAPPKAEAPDQP